MSIDKAEAIILNRRNFRETSIIASFYSREFGKLTGLLKGIRQEPSKFASPMDLFSLNEIIFYRKRNSPLHLVSACELKESFSPIRENISKIGMAAMMMELLETVMAAEDKNEEIFDLALSSLRELQANDNPAKVMTIFKIKLLSLSGFKPHFDSCVCCAEKILGQSKFSLSLGGLLCYRCNSKDVAARPIFRGTVASILHIEKNDLRNNLNLGMNPQIKKELELILNSFMNFHLQRDLKSQKVIDRMDDLVAVGE